MVRRAHVIQHSLSEPKWNLCLCVSDLVVPVSRERTWIWRGFKAFSVRSSIVLVLRLARDPGRRRLWFWRAMDVCVWTLHTQMSSEQWGNVSNEWAAGMLTVGRLPLSHTLSQSFECHTYFIASFWVFVCYSERMSRREGFVVVTFVNCAQVHSVIEYDMCVCVGL